MEIVFWVAVGYMLGNPKGAVKLAKNAKNAAIGAVRTMRGVK